MPLARAAPGWPRSCQGGGRRSSFGLRHALRASAPSAGANAAGQNLLTMQRIRLPQYTRYQRHGFIDIHVR
jgi:hypothetical protein